MAVCIMCVYLKLKLLFLITFENYLHVSYYYYLRMGNIAQVTAFKEGTYTHITQQDSLLIYYQCH